MSAPPDPDVVFDEQSAALRAMFFNVREVRPRSHVYALLDDACPVAREHPLHASQLAERPIRRERALVALHAEAKPDTWPPILLQLFQAGENGYPDEELIGFSLVTALDRCASINGAYVAAWIASDLAPQELARRLARACERFDVQAGRRRTMPLYKPHRMALLLDDAEARPFLHGFLAQIHLWAFVDAAATLRTLAPAEPTEPTNAASIRPGRLSLAQCRRQARVSMARRVILGLRKAGHEVPARAETKVDAVLVDAERIGLRHAEDIVFFALNSLTLSTCWHEHPQARRCIEQTLADGVPLAGQLSELTDHALDEISRFGGPRA